jgi:hypothetical protein
MLASATHATANTTARTLPNARFLNMGFPPLQLAPVEAYV